MAAAAKPDKVRNQKTLPGKTGAKANAARQHRPVQQAGIGIAGWMALAAVLLATAAVYWQVAGFAFIRTDDELYVYGNAAVKAGLRWGSAVWAFSRPVAGNWHPLTMLSLMADYHLAGSSPAWFHLVNLVLHLAGTLCLVIGLHRLTRCYWQSLFVGSVFALHPAHVESVAWISERKDVLSGLFLGLVLLAYGRYCRRQARTSFLVVLVCLGLGLMSKPMLVSVPILLLLLDYWPLERTGRPDANKKLNFPAGEKIPFFVLAAIFCVVTLIVQRGAGAMDTLESTPVPERLTNALVAYAVYVWKFFWPAGQAGLYPFLRQALPLWQPLLAALFLIAVTLATLRAHRSRPYLSVGWLWFCTSLVPVIGFVQVGPQASADRYTYIPYIGLSIMVAWGAPELLAFLMPKYRRQLLASLSVSAAAAMAVLSFQYLPHWKNDSSYWARVIEIRPDFARGYYNLALAEGEQGDVNGAMGHYRKALEVDPRCADANYGLANLLLAQGRLDEAIAHYEAELRLNPRQAGVHNNLALALARRGRLEEATEHYRAAVDADPQNADALRNWASELLARKDWEGARAKYEAFLKLQPDDYDAHCRIAGTYAGMGQWNQAVAHLKRAMQLQPQNPLAFTNLGELMSRRGDPQAALAYFRDALRLDAAFADAQYKLAQTLAAMSRKDEAVAAYQELLAAHPGHYWGHNDLGILLAEQGKLDQALAQFAAAIKIDPAAEAARNNQAKVMLLRTRGKQN
jgi:tetratricopeptide (TPR) repeat protein